MRVSTDLDELQQSTCELVLSTAADVRPLPAATMKINNSSNLILG